MSEHWQPGISVITVIDQHGLPERVIGQKAVFSLQGRLGSSISLPWVESELEALAGRSLGLRSFSVAGIYNPTRPQQKVTLMVDPYLPPHQLIILGGGHIARPLVKLGRLLGYQVVVVDDRADFVSADRFPEADKVICCSFEALDEFLDLGSHSSVVIVTRGHQHDLACLRQMLRHPLAYLGVIGSRRKVGMARELLMEEGWSAERLDSLYMPIGIDIGAQTPEEIAVSIAAELVKVRRGGKAASLKTGDDQAAAPDVGELPSGLDLDILRKVVDSADSGIPAALVTVVTAEGSTPRKAGARMLVWGDGRILGTVGGGKGEAEVCNEALKVIASGEPSLYRIVMNAENAAMEGMICGGSMEVFIESAEAFAGLGLGGEILGT